jgi:predicted dithiol-disulfide oxidoreductase (DUF899 family)
MQYQETAQKIASLRSNIAKLMAEMDEARAKVEPVVFADYDLERADGGKTTLSQLFGDKNNLIVIHNMGASCSYCTLWADGFNGVYPHLADKAAFVVATPDPSPSQRKFAEGRGWRFPMVSTNGTSFAKDCGYEESGKPRPGVSIFTRKDGKILRVADEPLHPGDDFCIVWPIFDLLPGGAGGWKPKYTY